jgi:hypothetical protein
MLLYMISYMISHDIMHDMKNVLSLELNITSDMIIMISYKTCQYHVWHHTMILHTISDLMKIFAFLELYDIIEKQ